MLLFVLVAAPLEAQPANPIAWSIQHRKVARLTSDGLVGTQLTLAVVDAWKQPDRTRALLAEGCSVGLTLGVVELLKRTTHEWRPDRSDRFSFPSGHTATAASLTGWNQSAGWAVTISTGYLRSAANRHHWWDTAAGAAIGTLARHACNHVRTQ